MTTTRKLDALDVAAAALRRRLRAEGTPTKETVGAALEEVAHEMGVEPSSLSEVAARALALSFDPNAIAKSVDATASALGMSPQELKKLVGERLERVAMKPAVAREEFAKAMSGDASATVVDGADKPRELFEMHAQIPADRTPELDELVHHARKSEGPALLNAIAQIKQVAKSDNYPFVRGDLANDPIVGPLLSAQRELSADERRTVIEAVLARGAVVDVKYRSQSTSAVYTVTFQETLDGKPIQAIGKPERGARSAIPTFARTVLQYQRDRLLGTGMVPPSSEAILSFDGGKTRELCSLMFCLRDAKLVGEDMPAFEALQNTVDGERQMKLFKLGLYLGDDLDHVPDGSGNYGAWFNSANTMIEGGTQLKHIDTEYSYGMPPIEIDPGILPANVDAPVHARLREVDAKEMGALAKEWAPDEDAGRAEARWSIAQKHLDGDVGKASAIIAQRMTALPAVPGTLRGDVKRIGDGYAQEIVGPHFKNGRALIVADLKTGKANVVEGGFLQQYEGVLGTHRDPRLWLDSIDYGWKTTGAVPLEDAKVGADGVRVQRFDRGYMTWNAAANDLRVKNLDAVVAGGAKQNERWGNLDEKPALFHGGFAAKASGGSLHLGRGLVVVNPKLDGAFVVDGFLEAYLSAWADGEAGHAALGLPTSNQHDEGGRQIQRFEHGYLSWSPSEGVVAHVDTDPYDR
jgi:hypothetical protein